MHLLLLGFEDHLPIFSLGSSSHSLFCGLIGFYYQPISLEKEMGSLGSGVPTFLVVLSERPRDGGGERRTSQDPDELAKG